MQPGVRATWWVAVECSAKSPANNKHTRTEYSSMYTRLVQLYHTKGTSWYQGAWYETLWQPLVLVLPPGPRCSCPGRLAARTARSQKC
jgi:hypothetical protein